MENATIEHERPLPSKATRPDYLRDTAYVLAVDTETTGFDWFGEDRPFLATVSDYDRDWLFYLPVSPADEEHYESGLTELRAAILDADALVFHNASFDIHMLVAAGVCTIEELLAKEIHDTELLARVVNSREANYKLKTLSQKYVDADAKDGELAVREAMLSMGLIKKIDQKKLPDRAYYDVWKVYPKVLEDYALNDTRITYDLWHTLLGKASEDNLAVYEVERALLPVITRMEHRGTVLDQDRVADLLGVHETLYEQARDRMVGMTRPDFDPGSRTMLLEALNEAGVTLTQRTPTGEIRVDKWVLEAHAGVPLVDAILEYRKSEKFLSTYLRPMKDRATIHPSFIQCGAWTGRMSCMRPNMQNIPVRGGAEIRSVFIPRPGNALIVADYSSIELRLLAWYMRDEGLWNIIRNGDPFLWLGEQVYGTPNIEVWPVERQPLKNGFYSMTYGAGGPKIAQTIGGGMTRAEGLALKKAMEKALGPAYSTLNRRIKSAVRRRGYVKTIGRRIQRVPHDKSYVGLNALIQGSSADVMKAAMVRTEPYLSDWGGYPLLTVHDEIVAEVPVEYADEALRDICAIMAIVGAELSHACNVRNGEPDAPILDLKAEGKVCFNHYGEAK